MGCKHRAGDNCKKDDRPCIHNADCFEPVPQANADRIRAMSDEELAWELMTWRIETCARLNGAESPYPYTQKGILEWLKQPVKDGEDDG